MSDQEFIEISKSFIVDASHRAGLAEVGLSNIESVFSFSGGVNLSKANLSRHRSRLQFEIPPSQVTVFLKRYDRPSIMIQIRNWLCHMKRASLARFEAESAKTLARAGIDAAKVIAFGEQWGRFFEKRSFMITEGISNAESLERRLPACFIGPMTREKLKPQREFVRQLALYVKKFHETGLRHRDLYFCHIFYFDDGRFYLIDLARVFRPVLLAERFRVKDIAQMYYSAPGRHFSKTDRLRFYRAYSGTSKLSGRDKAFIAKVTAKAGRMARHDKKHGRNTPFADCSQ